jgi:hypothetical protein
MKYAGILLLTLACASDSKPPEKPDPGMRGPVLTAAGPRQQVAVTPFAVAPTNLSLTIESIENPSTQPFSVRASLRWQGGQGPPVESEIATITPYPSDQAGTFSLVIPPAAGRSAILVGGRLTLILELLPIRSDQALVEPLQVTLGALTWR